tara:strand:- start:736 stop:1056 length:321 start_codon:yes stop_codon:yes gene_type:complete
VEEKVILMGKWTFIGKHGIRADRVLEALGIDGRSFTSRDFLGAWIDMHGTRECPLVNQVADYLSKKCEHVVIVKRGNQKGVKGSSKAHLYGVDELWLDERLGVEEE